MELACLWYHFLEGYGWWAPEGTNVSAVEGLLKIEIRRVNKEALEILNNSLPVLKILFLLQIWQGWDTDSSEAGWSLPHLPGSCLWVPGSLGACTACNSDAKKACSIWGPVDLGLETSLVTFSHCLSCLMRVCQVETTKPGFMAYSGDEMDSLTWLMSGTKRALGKCLLPLWPDRGLRLKTDKSVFGRMWCFGSQRAVQIGSSIWRFFMCPVLLWGRWCQNHFSHLTTSFCAMFLQSTKVNFSFSLQGGWENGWEATRDEYLWNNIGRWIS